MCGLVSVINKKPTVFNYGRAADKPEIIFNQLMVTSPLRGVDSTGILAVKSNNEYQWFKRALPVTDAVHMPGYIRTAKHVASSKYSMGHVRKKSSGAADDVNAHPYELDTLIGAHNGTLNYSWRNMFNDQTSSTDSMGMFNYIQDNSVYETMGMLESPGVVMYYDKENHTFNIVRSTSRPLAMIETADMFIFASESAQLDWIASRNNIYGESSELPAGKLHTFTDFGDGVVHLQDNIDFKKVVVAQSYSRYSPPKKKKVNTTKKTTTSLSERRKISNTLLEQNGLEKNQTIKFLAYSATKNPGSDKTFSVEGYQSTEEPYASVVAHYVEDKRLGIDSELELGVALQGTISIAREDKDGYLELVLMSSTVTPWKDFDKDMSEFSGTSEDTTAPAQELEGTTIEFDEDVPLLGSPEIIREYANDRGEPVTATEFKRLNNGVMECGVCDQILMPDDEVVWTDGHGAMHDDCHSAFVGGNS